MIAEPTPTRREPNDAAASVAAGWEHYAHGADVGVRGFGASKCEAFEQAALALTAIVTDPACVRPLHALALSCEAPDDELLLAEWLNAVIATMATERMLFGRFEVAIEGTSLAARVHGEAIEPTRHHPAVEPKGATFTTLRVAFEHGRWIAQTVVDV